MPPIVSLKHPIKSADLDDVAGVPVAEVEPGALPSVDLKSFLTKKPK